MDDTVGVVDGFSFVFIIHKASFPLLLKCPETKIVHVHASVMSM